MRRRCILSAPALVRSPSLNPAIGREREYSMVAMYLTQVGAVGSTSWGTLARGEAPASASGSGTRASGAVQGDRPTKPLPERLPE
jgi:hypothetical protein